MPDSQFSDFWKINEFTNSFYPKDDQQTTPPKAAASTGKRHLYHLINYNSSC